MNGTLPCTTGAGMAKPIRESAGICSLKFSMISATTAATFLGLDLDGGGDAHPSLGEIPESQVNRSALDAGAANVNAQDVHACKHRVPPCPGASRLANRVQASARLGPVTERRAGVVHR